MKNFWKNKNVFVTGINGFIGGNLSKLLLANGANVFGLIRDLNKDTFIYFESLTDKITFINGDLTNKDLISRIISEYRIDAVFHFAAQVEIGVALNNPYLTYETNIRGTYALLDGIKQSATKVQSIIIASSDKAYGSYPSSMMPYKEEYPLKPIFPYDVSKACADMIAQSYANEPFNMPIVVTRFCNIFGPGQLNFSAIIPDAIRSALNYSKFIPRGNGKQIRDYIYVEDVADLYLKMSQNIFQNPKKFRGETFNAGTKKGKSAKEVLKNIYMICENKFEYGKVLLSMKKRSPLGEIDKQIMDYKKINKFIGWKPQHTFNDGLTKTIKWYKNYLSSKYDKV
tara:strand:+ start:1608 stop:2630 length:1023 start_codon:yes stop_codon:yes gene_type:complete